MDPGSHHSLGVLAAQSVLADRNPPLDVIPALQLSIWLVAVFSKRLYLQHWELLHLGMHCVRVASKAVLALSGRLGCELHRCRGVFLADFIVGGVLPPSFTR